MLTLTVLSQPPVIVVFDDVSSMVGNAAFTYSSPNWSFDAKQDRETELTSRVHHYVPTNGGQYRWRS
jgi:hypothetical protein